MNLFSQGFAVGLGCNSMAKKKWMFLALGILAMTAVVAAYVALGLSAPRHRINDEGFKMIQVGMTQPQVEALLGRPPGLYRTHLVVQTLDRQIGVFESGKVPPKVQRLNWNAWYSDDAD